jgi:hypothetical protein
LRRVPWSSTARFMKFVFETGERLGSRRRRNSTRCSSGMLSRTLPAWRLACCRWHATTTTMVIMMGRWANARNRSRYSSLVSVQDVAPTRGACALESGSMLLIRLPALIARRDSRRSADLESITLPDRNNPCFAHGSLTQRVFRLFQKSSGARSIYSDHTQ